MTKPKTIKHVRDTRTGQYTDHERAKTDPDHTVTERDKITKRKK
jgi:hypothetical protein